MGRRNGKRRAGKGGVGGIKGGKEKRVVAGNFGGGGVVHGGGVAPVGRANPLVRMSLPERPYSGAVPVDPKCRRVGVMVVVFVVTFLVIFGGVVGYALCRVPEYRGTAVVEVLRGLIKSSGIITGTGYPGGIVASDAKFHDGVQLMESDGVASDVAKRLKPDEVKRFMAPYEKDVYFGTVPTAKDLLIEGRKVEADLKSLMIKVSFEHPNPEVAAQVANYFAEEFVAANARVNADEMMKLVGDLPMRVEQQKKKVEEIQGKMNDMIVKYGRVALDPENNTPQSEKDTSLISVQAEFKAMDSDLRADQAMEKELQATAANQKTEFNVTAPAYRIVVTAVPAEEPVGLTMAE